MNSTPVNQVRWTTADLMLFEGDRNHRYEIIDGELFVTRAPHWKHQAICINIGTALKLWSDESGLGEAAITPGIVFSDADNYAIGTPPRQSYALSPLPVNGEGIKGWGKTRME